MSIYHNSDGLYNPVYCQIIIDFGVNPWENMFNHVLTHKESLQTQNMIGLSYLEGKHPTF